MERRFADLSRAARALLRPALMMLVATAFTCPAGSGVSDYTVLGRFPHDTTAYTQGLVYSDGHLFESTGRLGYSKVRRFDLATGNELASVDLADNRFGEGLALLDGKLYQLTWKSGVAYVYEAETLALVDSFNYTGEGWGLTTDGTHLIMSDGTETLRFRNPSSFDVVYEITVRDGGLPLTYVNELEYVDGMLYANIYQSDRIVRIDASTGEILDWYDLEGLLSDAERTSTTDVLNGIAFRTETGNLLMTGKLWPAVFEIELRGESPDAESQSQ